MKRLAWLALLAFGTLLVHVSPMEPLAMQAPASACGGDCCSHPGKGTCPMCTACAPGVCLAVLATDDSFSVTLLPAIRLETPDQSGAQLNYPPPLPPPRVA